MKLELRGITKRFGSFTANDHIDLVVEPGEIHALLGENGAGKSTLMNVLYGLYQADEGTILLDDVEQHFAGPGDAMAAGIGMVHQHFMLIPVFTVAENVMLGHEPTRGGVLLDLDTARSRVREISERFGFNVDPDALVEHLPVGAQQRVEIIKALALNAEVLVLDEPTAVLTPQETDELMEIMDQLRASGKSIVFISHKLREVRKVADRITVIRRGKVVGTALPSESNEELAAKMVGRAVDLSVEKDPPTLGETTFRVANLTVFDETGHKQVDDLSFEVAEGEILVIAGVQGNGQTELTEAILGLQKKALGSITLDGEELLGRSVKKTLDAGLGFVPEDRTVDGIVAEFTITENMVLDRADRPPFAKGIALDLGAMRDFALKGIEDYDVRTPSIDTPAGRLSGGNQQKVVLARELGRELRMFIASQPTRGLDVGSIEFVHEQIVRVRDTGIPVIIVSTELDEVVELADRIMVMYQGRSVGIVDPTTSREALGQMMAGIPA
ncbi:ABC transporter ATP-binding protein [Pseudoclavibacter chungangensis]|uniref:ABC transporter ATP-binding protein n=1 Tax=Pseudoclavibacter chungangensis TaxID=587635 RepID=A0A7J5BYQ8_9MICO|nr:ABC transporter ATP-binding protein [Pseudoclavibacter chungangensis]KAB1659438.1 ABC transporter ATP-binding protein [Pseudoclavibacter chungangensis]NYJ67710.1 simple sugar transport system ATP-binding protein [Pseudoclavibacter chungangensis]